MLAGQRHHEHDLVFYEIHKRERELRKDVSPCPGEVARPPCRGLRDGIDCVFELAQEGVLGKLTLVSIPAAFVLNLCSRFLETSAPFAHRSDR